MAKLTRTDLEKYAGQGGTRTDDYIKVGMSTCGIAAGADEVFAALVEEAAKHAVKIRVEKCGCVGMCYAEPLVEVKAAGMPPVIYGKVNKEMAGMIIEKHVVGGTLVNDAVFGLRAKD